MIEYWQHEVNIMRRMSGISALPLFLEAHWSSLLITGSILLRIWLVSSSLCLRPKVVRSFSMSVKGSQQLDRAAQSSCHDSITHLWGAQCYCFPWFLWQLVVCSVKTLSLLHNHTLEPTTNTLVAISVQQDLDCQHPDESRMEGVCSSAF